MPYAIADKRADSRDAPSTRSGLGAWRSVLNSQHGFFKESFIDELAHAAGKDPFAVPARPAGRSAALQGRARARGGHGRLGTARCPSGEGRGIAIAESFGSIVGEVAHVAVSPDGTLQVKQVFAVVDCGDVVNTDTATAQVEGGIIFGLSAAMVGEITIDEGRVVESNFRDHQMIHLADAPAIRSSSSGPPSRPAGSASPACRRSRPP